MWSTQVDPERLDEYLRFAHTISLPMFREQRGFLGVLFAGDGGRQIVISFWSDLDAVATLASSSSYSHTVQAIEATGFLRGSSHVEVFALEGGLPPAGI
jgi:heme-degrading monooxygenase HmoA